MGLKEILVAASVIGALQSDMPRTEPTGPIPFLINGHISDDAARAMATTCDESHMATHTGQENCMRITYAQVRAFASNTFNAMARPDICRKMLLENEIDMGQALSDRPLAVLDRMILCAQIPVDLAIRQGTPYDSTSAERLASHVIHLLDYYKTHPGVPEPQPSPKI